MGGGGTEIRSSDDAPLLGPAAAAMIFFLMSEDLLEVLAVPYLACLRRTLRGGFTTLSTYASFVDLAGADLSIDCFMLAVRVFSFASRSSKQR